MEEKVIKELKGHSGSQIYLMQNDQRIFVRKIGNVERNYERLQHLEKYGFSVPKIYTKTDDILDMEYIHGLDMRSYLLAGNIHLLENFLIDNLNKLAEGGYYKDYTSIYENKLKWMEEKDCSELPFTKNELISKLPKYLPCSNYHGDMTLENILYSQNSFYFIDCVTIEYDSYIFDIAKLRQDLECKWFLRNNPAMMDVKLQNIQKKILSTCPEANNDSLLILMLLRVYLHTKPEDDNYKFIMKEIKRLWK